MCTVTYIPQSNENSFILTSNRDEKEFRPTIAPRIYQHGEFKIGYPKDEKAGGSWIAINNRGQMNCLLNGGVVAHQKKEYHTISRGNILTEFTSSGQSVFNYFSNKKLINVEPFTIIAIEHTYGLVKKLSEFIWDGDDKYFRNPDKHQPHIWSSVTLYNQEQRKIRRSWFEQFYNENSNDLTVGKLLSFHAGNHIDDDAFNVIMKRDDGIKTVSITQVYASAIGSKMIYSDLLSGFENDLELCTVRTSIPGLL